METVEQKIFTDGKYHVSMPNGKKDLMEILNSVFNLTTDDVEIKYIESKEYWEIFNKLDNTSIGALNFNPDEN